MSILHSISRWPRPRRILAGVAFLLAVACITYLVLGPKPWVSGIAAGEEAGVELDTSHFRVSGLWWGAMANGILAVAAIALSRWLTRPLADPKRIGFVFSIERNPAAVPSGAKWWIGGSVLLAIAVTLSGTLPRMDNGLWHDEDKTVRNFVVGQFLRSKTSGEVKYREVTWEETVWNSRTPNHTLFGILARLSHQAFPPEQDPKLPYVNEWALRLPALLGGLAGLAMLAVALASLGFHRAAFLVPLLLSVHPWFLRYCSEARGYSLLFLLVPLCVYLLTKALATARWKWWVMLGAAEFLTVYAVLNGAHFLVILNLAALGWIGLSPGRAILLRRWLVSCSVAMVLGIQMMGAFLPQFQNYVESTKGDSGEFDRVQLKDNLTGFATGIRYQYFGDEYAPSFKQMIEEDTPLRTGLLTLAVFGFAAAGAVRLCRAGPRGIALLAVFLLPAPFFYLHAAWTQAHIFYWYTIVGLPLFWGLIAIGAAWVGERRPMAVTACIAMVFVPLLFWVTLPQREFQHERPLEYNRESAYLTHATLDPRDPGYDESISLNISRHPMVYDGAAHLVSDTQGLLRWLEIADETDRPLFLNYGSEWHLLWAFTTREQREKQQRSEFLQLIDDPEIFGLEAQFYGVDPDTNRTVKKYVPGSYIAREAREK